MAAPYGSPHDFGSENQSLIKRQVPARMQPDERPHLDGVYHEPRRRDVAGIIGRIIFWVAVAALAASGFLK